MANEGRLPVHEVNKWVWYKLRNDRPVDFAAYLTPGSPVNGLVPIIPSQQYPELVNIEGGAPFIVYTYALTGAAESWWMHADNVVYTIYDNDEARLRRTLIYLNQLLRRVDYSVTELDQHNRMPTADGQTPQPSPFDVKFIILTGGTGPDPFAAEGGRQAAMLTFRIEYTAELNDNVTTSLDNPAGMRV